MQEQLVEIARAALPEPMARDQLSLHFVKLAQ
jgi:hypothetical protein